MFSRILQGNHLGQDIFCFECFKIMDYISLIDKRIFKLSISYWISCIPLCFSKNGPSHPSCQTSVCGVACGTFYQTLIVYRPCIDYLHCIPDTGNLCLFSFYLSHSCEKLINFIDCCSKDQLFLPLIFLNCFPVFNYIDFCSLLFPFFWLLLVYLTLIFLVLEEET